MRIDVRKSSLRRNIGSVSKSALPSWDFEDNWAEITAVDTNTDVFWQPTMQRTLQISWDAEKNIKHRNELYESQQRDEKTQGSYNDNGSESEYYDASEITGTVFSETEVPSTIR